MFPSIGATVSVLFLGIWEPALISTVVSLVGFALGILYVPSAMLTGRIYVIVVAYLFGIVFSFWTSIETISRPGQGGTILPKYCLDFLWFGLLGVALSFVYLH